MTNNIITQSDLQSLKNEIKLEIGEEQRQIRHASAAKLQEDYLSMDAKINEYKSDLRITNLVMDHMQKDIEVIKKMVEGLVEALPKKYVTYGDLDPIKERQKEHDAIIKRLAWGAFILLLSLIGGFIGLSKYI